MSAVEFVNVNLPSIMGGILMFQSIDDNSLLSTFEGASVSKCAGSIIEHLSRGEES
jgi:hypothetical protein